MVCDHPLDSGVVDRIAELKATIPQPTIDRIASRADELSPAAVLAMLAEQEQG